MRRHCLEGWQPLEQPSPSHGEPSFPAPPAYPSRSMFSRTCRLLLACEVLQRKVDFRSLVRPSQIAGMEPAAGMPAATLKLSPCYEVVEKANFHSMSR